ncbi:MAG: hypothetical protein ACTSQP_14860 [Promethearchaeota archaeon]
MPKKYKVIFRTIYRSLFWVFIIIILIVFIYNQEIAMWLTLIAIIIYSITYFPPLISRIRLLRLMKQYYMIEDDTIAQELKKPLSKVQLMLFELMQKQRKKKWLIVYREKHYTFYHAVTIEKFLDLYSQGYGEKEILKELHENDLRTRAEIKAIRETLKKNERLPARKEIKE